MITQLKKIVIASPLLIRLAMFFHKRRLKKKFDLKLGKNVFIGTSTICEGKNYFPLNSSISSSSIGYGSYLGANTVISKSQIGRYTSIGPNVTCIFGKHPSNIFVSTHPAFFSINNVNLISYTKTNKFNEYADAKDPEGKYSIKIGNDVWIGANVSIMDGIEIGDGAIIAANALVNKNVAPYTIIGGVPGKVIKKRFSDDQINFLLKFKWWNKSKEWVSDNASLFEDIEKFMLKFKND